MPKKTASKKAGAAKKPKASAPRVKAPKAAGAVIHFYNHIGVAIVKFAKPFEVGAKLHFLGATTDFKAKISSMQFDHKPIEKAKKGQEVGIKVGKRVREGDKVYEAAE